MDKNMQNIFDNIHAETQLKENTMHFLQDALQTRRKRYYPQQMLQKARMIAAYTSAALFLIICGFSYYFYFTPVAYVDVDVNPSIELTLNRFNRIIKASPHNDDGAQILNGTDISNSHYDEAIQNLIDAMITQGYLEKDGLVSVTVQSYDKSQESRVITAIQDTVTNSLQVHQVNAETDIFPITEEVKTYAHDNHVSPAKYIAITQLQEVDPTTTFESCAMRSVREIRQLTQEMGGRHHRRNSMHERNSNASLDSSIDDNQQTDNPPDGNQPNNGELDSNQLDSMQSDGIQSNSDLSDDGNLIEQLSGNNERSCCKKQRNQSQ